MPDPNKPTSSDASDKAKEEELVRLRAEVSALRDELARRPPPVASARRSARASGDYDAEEADARADDRDDFGRRTSNRDDETDDIIRDIPARAVDEVSKLIRGLAFAYLEQIRLSADVVTTIAEEVFQRNRPVRTERGARTQRRRDPEEDTGSRRRYEDEGEREHAGRARRRRTVAGLTGDLPGDIYAGIVKAVDQSLQIPGRTVERFYESFKEAEKAEPTFRRRRAEDRPERPAPGAERREADAEHELDQAQEDASRATREATHAALEATKSETGG
jgi:hypothetical protein